jgi:hypothetical protein
VPVRLVKAEYNPAIGYLRAFLVVLVVAHHSAIAYMKGAPALPHSLLATPRLWRAFPIVDHQQWAGFGVLVVFNDVFFMSLMFFVSGLFVWSSLRRKGAETFVRDRALRLGLPFIVAALIISPLAYFPTYLATAADPTIGSYLRTWLSFRDWPTGPAWFISLLLTFDCFAAIITALKPDWGEKFGQRLAFASRRPFRFFLLLVGLSAAAYFPMVTIFGPDSWTSWGPIQFQTCRVFHYAVYFVMGIGVGAYGIERGLLESGGKFASRWLRWTMMMGLALPALLIVLGILPSIARRTPLTFVAAIGSSAFALTCAALSFGVLALFVHFVHRRRPIFDSLSDNQYGMYLIHYPFVIWLQYLLLSTSLPAVIKGSMVFLGALILSWSTSAAIRRIPTVRRIV